MNTAPVRILIADDHALMRRGLRELLADEFSQVECGEAGTSQQALELIWKQTWDLLILDLQMPGRNGFEVLEELKGKKTALPVLVLSAYPEDQFGLRAVQAGAAGYLNKLSANKELIDAVKTVLKGGTYVSPSLAQAMVQHLRIPAPEARHSSLSNREFQVMLMVAGGKSLKEIASELALSAKTVSTFRRRLLRKMNLRNNAELVQYVLQHQLLG